MFFLWSASVTGLGFLVFTRLRIVNLLHFTSFFVAGREGWIADYEVGFSADGAITALKYNFYIDAGIQSDDTAGSAFMGMYWADNAYFLPNYRADATLCYTNTPARTSMRAPGVVQTSFCTELVVERVARELGLPIAQVQQRNFIRDGALAICGQVITDCTLPTVWSTLLQRSRYEQRLQLANSYNTRSLWRNAASRSVLSSTALVGRVTMQVCRSVSTNRTVR